MAKVFVQNLTHPVSSEIGAGIVIDAPGGSPEAARDLFLADHPASAGDVIAVFNFNTAYELVNVVTPQQRTIDQVSLPAVGH